MRPIMEDYYLTHTGHILSIYDARFECISVLRGKEYCK